MKIIIIVLAVVSFFIACVIVFMNIFAKAKRISQEKIFNNYFKECIDEFLLDILKEALPLKPNPENNILLIDIESIKDKFLVLFSARPGVDTDGEIFIVAGEIDIDKIKINNAINVIFKISTRKTDTFLMITDSKDNKYNYYKYTDKKYKRIKNIIRIISEDSTKIHVFWATDTFDNISDLRKQIINFINKEKLK